MTFCRVRVNVMTDLQSPHYQEVASASEAVQAHDFFCRMLTEQFSSTFSADAIQAYREKYDRALFEQRVAAQDAVIAAMILDQQVIGLVIGGAPNGGVASLDWVVVAPGHQGQGLGQQLVAGALASYRNRGAHKVVLYTETESARQFYERCGMTCEGVHPQHWWGLTHYCMGVVLGQAGLE